MKYDIVNKISKSPIMTVDLDDFALKSEIIVFDIKNWLKNGLVLIENDFRDRVKSFDWSIYIDKLICIQCSNDAIIPDWALILISSELKKLNIRNFIGSVDDFRSFLITERISNMDVSIYKNKPVIIKGCSKNKFKEFYYSLLIEKIQPVAKRIMFGEACSFVPIFKKER